MYIFHLVIGWFTLLSVYAYVRVFIYLDRCVRIQMRYKLSNYIHILLYYIYMYRNIMNTTRARASWVTQVSKRVEAHEEKGEPLGTTPDCLAVTAVGCVSLSA